MREKPANLFEPAPPELLARRAGERVPLFVACGLGVNSTAGLILLHRLGDRPDAILFADTGAEKPETYAFGAVLSAWCESVGFPAIVTVKRAVDHARQKAEAKYDTLEGECLAKRCLPSIAYYHRSCSEKWKQQPQEKWANARPEMKARWKAGLRCVKAIFYDADEPYRAKHFQNAKWSYWHPLIDHDWGRDECLKAITAEGLPVPPKSSCYFCPEMTRAEIFALQKDSPDLLARALAIEANAVRLSEDHKGLGKHEYSWRDLIDGKVPLPVVPERPRIPCICYDG